ncbi:MAG: hypothetical protein J07HN6_02600 [Halonotius sp. J07HN6]|nr:MAG: hypothetical protein J07HN6_02600 [Halonotius sp. J07HN6]
MFSKVGDETRTRQVAITRCRFGAVVTLSIRACVTGIGVACISVAFAIVAPVIVVSDGIHIRQRNQVLPADPELGYLVAVGHRGQQLRHLRVRPAGFVDDVGLPHPSVVAIQQPFDLLVVSQQRRIWWLLGGRVRILGSTIARLVAGFGRLPVRSGCLLSSIGRIIGCRW